MIALTFSAKVQLTKYVIASTEMTHNNDEALIAALATARTMSWLIKNPSKEINQNQIFQELHRANLSQSPLWENLLQTMEQFLNKDQTTLQFQTEIGCKSFVSGYSFHSVPVAIYTFLKYHGDFRKTIFEAVSVGGDSDTIAFIAGSLAGASQGVYEIPNDLLEGISAWPCDVNIVRSIQFSEGGILPFQINEFPWFFLFLRNVVSWVAIGFHVVRRIVARII